MTGTKVGVQLPFITTDQGRKDCSLSRYEVAGRVAELQVARLWMDRRLWMTWGKWSMELHWSRLCKVAGKVKKKRKFREK